MKLYQTDYYNNRDNNNDSIDSRDNEYNEIINNDDSHSYYSSRYNGKWIIEAIIHYKHVSDIARFGNPLCF